MSFKILTINPGSTSTKIAVFENEKEICSATLRHTTEELVPFPTVASQFQFRKNIILSELQKTNIDIHSLHAIVGRGGLVCSGGFRFLQKASETSGGGTVECSHFLAFRLLCGQYGE